MGYDLEVKLPQTQCLSYLIHIARSLDELPQFLRGKAYSSYVIITDHRVKMLYGRALKEALVQAGYKTWLFSFSPGEGSKTAKTKEALESQLLVKRCDRDTLILALGGGVVGDLAGYLAATYLRGVAYIQIPTTLLAMIDSSIGGKTGINTPQGKNLIGSIYQPQAVIADLNLLKSLEERHFINGLIEAIKVFLIADREGFYLLTANLADLKKQGEILSEVVKRAVSLKAGIVSRDEREKGERSLLNFGHTLGHALEKVTDYKLLHGYAVGYGILIESAISYLLGLQSWEVFLEIQALMEKLGIFGEDLKKYPTQMLIKATLNDKKTKAKKVRYVLLKEIGLPYLTEEGYTHSVSSRVVKKALDLVVNQAF